MAFDVAVVLLTSAWLHGGLLASEFIEGLFDYAEQRRRIMTKSSVFKKKKNVHKTHVMFTLSLKCDMTTVQV